MSTLRNLYISVYNKTQVNVTPSHYHITSPPQRSKKISDIHPLPHPYFPSSQQTKTRTVGQEIFADMIFSRIVESSNSRT